MNSNQSDICIVTTRNIFDAPCLAKYQSLVSKSFDIIYWDRCGIDESCDACNCFRFEKIISPNSGKLKKLQAYIEFMHFINKILVTRTYKKLIIFPTQAAWLIRHQLSKRYKNKYILDIRDYAGENHALFKWLTQKAVKNAGICSITSPAYRLFLPSRNYIVSHNIQPIDEKIIMDYRSRKHIEGEPISLSFIGSVRFIDQQKKILMVFKNDPRFHLNYIGKGSEQLADFCKEQDIRNITLIGRFDRSQLPYYYLKTDVAINVYGNHDPYLDYALSNKLYSAALMGMPILVSPNTYMADIAQKYGFGFSFNMLDCNICNAFYKWYCQIDISSLRKGCDDFYHHVLEDEEIFKSTVNSFLNS